MKHEFSKSVLARAVRIARQMGHESTVALIAGREPGPEEALLDAAYRGDMETIRKLLIGAPNIGERMPDGTIYAGVSPYTGEKLFAATADAPRLMTFKDADCFAKTLRLHGYKDWRLPARGELKLLFNNRAEIGGFTTAPRSWAGDHWYWSSTECAEDPRNVWAVSFASGSEDSLGCRNSLAWRVVRAEP